ncbi:hypothetical protein HQN89_30430 [Paenibacillus frigoriresistens]|uniref:hypothetical protein n=1 Tax=Paenibacillus alginolyticus TaxID=59839 RepID=UPI00156557C4|nr:hypothetical protein [Paenibacillus frigoriresistens]NRF95203.1 hypothetical protein [Paenibacillus frigoriresistens]
MNYKSFGSQSSSFSVIGLGVMGMSDLYGRSSHKGKTLFQSLERGAAHNSKMP